MDNTCCDVILAPFRCFGLFIWPPLCMTLGLVAGVVVSATTTVVVFLITLLRTPFHIFKMLTVTATTEECFSGVLGNTLRWLVFLCVPAAHIVFLGFVTAFSATIGTLYYIGKCTKVIYKHEYTKSIKTLKSNARAEPKSYVGKYWKACEDYMEDDELSHPTIKLLKMIFAVTIGLTLSTVVLIPFSVAMVAITVYRLPINFFKTMKIACFTVVLKWDLRLLAIVTLPIIHTIFPVLVFVSSMVWSIFWTWCQTSENIMEDKSPFHDWSKLMDAVKEYLEEHKKFVSKRCSAFDHPSGIPYGWDGTSYGLDIARILRFQINFLIFWILALIQTPIIAFGSALILSLKFIPSCIHCWGQYGDSCCCNSSSNCVSVLSLWPFHLLAIILLPAGVLIFSFCLFIFIIVGASFELLPLVFAEDRSIWECLEVSWNSIKGCDEMSGEIMCNEFMLLRPWVDIHCCFNNRNHARDDPQHTTQGTLQDSINPDLYWDRFTSQCIQTTAKLLEKGFLDQDSVTGMDPSSIQSIPSAAILSILMDSLHNDDTKVADVYWQLDGTICRAECRGRLGNISYHLWPMVHDLQCFLHKHKKSLPKPENLEFLEALLCDNGDGSESNQAAIRDTLESAEKNENQISLFKEIRTKICSGDLVRSSLSASHGIHF